MNVKKLMSMLLAIVMVATISASMTSCDVLDIMKLVDEYGYVLTTDENGDLVLDEDVLGDILSESNAHMETNGDGDYIYGEVTYENVTDTANREDPEKNDGSINDDRSIYIGSPVSYGTIFKKYDQAMQVYNKTTDDYRTHLGLDIAVEDNYAVYAVADGTVTNIWIDNELGHCLAIKHEGDVYTLYKNLNGTYPAGIEEGSEVRMGQIIATVGDSATVEAADVPHLHFEMTVDDLIVDPMKYFNDDVWDILDIDLNISY